MAEIKPIIGIAAAALAFVAYAPYIRDIFRGSTKPHVFSWLLWAFLTAIISALQISSGSGWGSLTTLSITLISLFIFFSALKDGKKLIKKVDVVFFVMGLLSILLWLVVKQPVWSMLLLVTIDILAFAPTIRKSWNAPYSETLATYIIVIFRHILAVFAIREYNIITSLFPATWIIANTFFATLLIVRRKRIDDPRATNS